MMRHILLLIALTFVLPANIVSAQEGVGQYHMLSLGIGDYTPDYLLDGYRPGRPTEFDYRNKGLPGVVYTSYKYYFGSRVYAGFVAAVEQQHGDWLDNEIPGGNVFNLQTTNKGLFNRTSFTTGFNFYYEPVSHQNFHYYAVVGLGVTHEFETDEYYPSFYNDYWLRGVNSLGAIRQHLQKTHPNFYVAPFGFRTGKVVSFFGEIGFGYQGIFNAGLTYHIASKLFAPRAHGKE